jgi:hypothetical protein
MYGEQWFLGFRESQVFCRGLKFGVVKNKQTSYLENWFTGLSLKNLRHESVILEKLILKGNFVAKFYVNSTASF